MERQSEQREEVLGVEEPAELDELPVGDVEDLERPRVVTTATRTGPVLPESGLAVGHGGDEPGASARGALTLPEGQDLVAATQPHLERGHRLRGVLVDERGERVHVVALERVDVPAEQLLLL